MGTKYELDRRIVRFAAVIDIRYISSMLALPPLGELLNTCAAPPATGASDGKYSTPCSTAPVVLIQLSMKTACICATTGPSTWKWVSRQWSGSWASPVHLSAMPTPPVKPIRPSTTRSLRWVRLFRRPRCDQCGGWYFSISTPADFISSTSAWSIFCEPTQSSRMCTLTPARARSARASANSLPIAPDQ